MGLVYGNISKCVRCVAGVMWGDELGFFVTKWSMGRRDCFKLIELSSSARLHLGFVISRFCPFISCVRSLCYLIPLKAELLLLRGGGHVLSNSEASRRVIKSG